MSGGTARLVLTALRMNYETPHFALPDSFVTIMIATRNRAGELAKTLAACQEQTWPHIEILVVDDASTDGTFELVRQRFPTVNVVRNPVNRGSIASRNDILRRARGQFILGLDDDSRLVEPDACARLVARMDSEPDLGIIALQPVGPEHPERLTDAGRLRGEWHVSSFAFCGVFIRRALLDRTDLLPELFFHAYDEPDLSLRAWDAGYRVLQWNDLLVYHEFSPLNRREQRMHHLHTRNEIASLWMRYPWHLVLPATAARLAAQARFAARRGWLLREPLVWAEAIARLPSALFHRRPVSTRAVKIALALNRFQVADPAQAWALADLPWRTIFSQKKLLPKTLAKTLSKCQAIASQPSARQTAKLTEAVRMTQFFPPPESCPVPGVPFGQPPTVLVAHAGKQHAYRHALAVQRAGCLAHFVTSGYYKPKSFPDRLLATTTWFDRPLRRRHLSDLDPGRVVRRWDLEFPELAYRAAFGNRPRAERLVCRRDARFDRWVARRWADADQIYWGFQGSCLYSLLAARAAGRIAVAEFATAHVTLAVDLLAAEAQKHPDWADSISNLHFPAWYRRRLEREPHQADFCIAASQFTRRSLLHAGVKAKRIRLLPLGADLDQFTPSDRPPGGPFRILFVGGVGQRKGVKYLLEAYQRMRNRHTELVLVGPLLGAGRGLDPYRGQFTHLGRLDQPEVLREMRRAHVLVLPSVFEGFGLVIPEAMATGMPVIASTHSIGPEVIRDGHNGFVIEPHDVDALAAHLDWLAGHPDDARRMGRQAALDAHALSWDAHADAVGRLLLEFWIHPIHPDVVLPFVPKD